MRNELDEKLKKTLGSPHPLDIERFTNNVMGHLKEELKREERYSTVLKITAGLAAVIVILILTLIFIPNYGPSTPLETFESSEMLNNTLPCYVLNDQTDIRIVETRPCDVLPPLLD